jgi:hypothetical protein
MYKIQTHWDLPVSKQNWQDTQRLNLAADVAIKCVREMSNLSRIVCPVRAINESGHIIATYNPDQDMRLPGSKWEAIAKIANEHPVKFWYDWEVNGRQEKELIEVWNKAEKQLQDTDGFWCETLE